MIIYRSTDLHYTFKYIKKKKNAHQNPSPSDTIYTRVGKKLGFYYKNKKLGFWFKPVYFSNQVFFLLISLSQLCLPFSWQELGGK